MVCQENHYYPFGLNMAGIEYYGEPGTPYQYNGKEKEEIFDLGWYDFGARWYSPQIGRWFNTDPAEQVASPYDFCGGDPIANVDPDGRSFARWFAQNEQVMVTGSLAMVGFALSTASFGTATPAVVAVAAAVVATTASAGFATYYAGGTPGQIFASVAISLTISGLTACAGTGVANAGFTETPAGAIVTGALLGGGAASLSTGLNNLVMGRSFESGMLANALIGAWGGAIAAAGAKSKLESANSKAANLAAKKAKAAEMEVKPKEENIAYLDDYDPIIDGPYPDDGPGQSYGGPRTQKQIHNQTNLYNPRPYKVGLPGISLGDFAKGISHSMSNLWTIMKGSGDPFQRSFHSDSYYTLTNRDGSMGPGGTLLYNTVAVETTLLGFGGINSLSSGGTWGVSAFSTANSVTGNRLVSNKYALVGLSLFTLGSSGYGISSGSIWLRVTNGITFVSEAWNSTFYFK